MKLPGTGRRVVLGERKKRTPNLTPRDWFFASQLARVTRTVTRHTKHYHDRLRKAGLEGDTVEIRGVCGGGPSQPADDVAPVL